LANIDYIVPIRTQVCLGCIQASVNLGAMPAN